MKSANWRDEKTCHIASRLIIVKAGTEKGYPILPVGWVHVWLLCCECEFWSCTFNIKSLHTDFLFSFCAFWASLSLGP